MFHDGAERRADRQTDGHGDSMTNSAQWGRVGEKNFQSQIQLQFFICGSAMRNIFKKLYYFLFRIMLYDLAFVLK